MAPSSPVRAAAPELIFIPTGQELPAWTNRDALACFLHEHLAPYRDTLPDIRRGLDDALENRPWPGGFVLLARHAALKREIENIDQFESWEAANISIAEHIHGFYNLHRRYSALKYNSPIEFELIHSVKKAA